MTAPDEQMIERPCYKCRGTGRQEHYVGSTRNGDRYISVPCPNGCAALAPYPEGTK